MKMSVALVVANGDGTGRLVRAVSGPEEMVLQKLDEPRWQDGLVIEVDEGLAIEAYFVPDMEDPLTLAPKPPAPGASEPPVPATVTALQFRKAAVKLGHITKDEARAWASGAALPAAVLAVLATISDPDVQFEAEMDALDMTTAELGAPLVAAALDALGLTEADRDDLFRLAATL